MNIGHQANAEFRVHLHDGCNRAAFHAVVMEKLETPVAETGLEINMPRFVNWAQGRRHVIENKSRARKDPTLSNDK